MNPVQNLFRVIPAALALATCGGCALSLSKSPQKDHVLILPGILGGPAAGAARLQRELDRRADVSAQIWDWRWFSGRMIGSLKDDASTRRAADELATKVAGWTDSHPEVNLHIVAISGGVLVTWLACRAEQGSHSGIEPAMLETIILLSGSMETDRSPTPLTTAARRGVFNYASASGDKMLEWLQRPSVGIEGFVDSTGISETFVDSRDRIGRGGGHVDALLDPYVEECVIPLITSNARTWSEACRD